MAADGDGEKPTKTVARKKASKTLRALAVGTVVYVAVLLLLLSQTAGCNPPEAPAETTWLSMLLGDYLRCRSLNELGDFLAGAFAPLAFLWLAGAVFIQSRELAAQREELEETQTVMREQARESKAATAYIGEQTAILKMEQEERIRKQADDEFDQAIGVLVSMLARRPPWVGIIDGEAVDILLRHKPSSNRAADATGRTIKLLLTVSRDTSHQNVFHAITRRFDIAIETVRRDLPRDAVVVELRGVDGLDALDRYLGALVEKEPLLSPAHRTRLLALGVAEARHAVQTLYIGLRKLEALLPDINQTPTSPPPK